MSAPTASKRTAIVLLGHGSRDPQWAEPMRRIQALVAARADPPVVSLAFLEFATPGLEQAIGTAVAQGAERVRVVPIFLGQGGHLRRDVTALLGAARRVHSKVEIELAAPMGEDPAVIAAIADWAAGE